MEPDHALPTWVCFFVSGRDIMKKQNTYNEELRLVLDSGLI